MPQVVVRGESVYQCTVCNRKTRVPTNVKGLDVMGRCTITSGCNGKLNRVVLPKDIISTPTITPAITGLQDWVQRKVLFIYTQSMSSAKWTITHKLNNIPIIHVFVQRVVNGSKQLVLIPSPTIKTIDQNISEIIFDKEETGIAHCVTLSSQNNINPTQAIKITPTQNVLISNDIGLLSIGTIDNNPTFNLPITFDIAGQPSVDIVYNKISNIASISSPWTGTSQVFLNGQTYTVRSVNLISHPAAIQYFLSGQIPPQGGNLYINNNPKHGDIVILGATPPFGTVDRIIDKYIDFSDEKTTNTNNILYSYGKIYASPSIIKSIYPYISVV